MAADIDVHTEGLDEQAKALDGAGEEVDSLKGCLPTPERYPARVLGGAEVGSAFNAFAGAWLAECETLGGALHELADKLRTSSDGYRSVEDEVMDMLGPALAMGPELVTMPHGLANPAAPAGGGSPFG